MEHASASFSPSLNPKSLKQAALLFKVQWVETLLVSWLYTEIEPESRPTVSHPTGEQHWNTVPSKAPWKPPLQSTTGAIRTPGYPTGVPGRDGWENKTTIEDTFGIKDTYNVQALPAILLLSQNVILVELLILKTIALHQTCQTWKWHNVFKARHLKWNTQAHLFHQVWIRRVSSRQLYFLKCSGWKPCWFHGSIQK